MKTQYFQYPTNMKLFVLVTLIAPIFQLLNYALNPSMVGRWDLYTYLWSQAVIEVFLIGLSVIFSKQVWARIHITSQSLDVFLYGRKVSTLAWAEMKAMLITKRIFDRVLLVHGVSKNAVYSAQISFGEIQVLYQRCSYQPIKDELRKIIDSWDEIKWAGI